MTTFDLNSGVYTFFFMTPVYSVRPGFACPILWGHYTISTDFGAVSIIMLVGIASLVGIITGLVKKDKKITKVSLIAFIIIALIFIVEGFFME